MSTVADEIAEQHAANASGASLYESFASHREHMTRLVREAAPGGLLCVLGAGNCNDLDLAQIAANYREVHLVDFDQKALDRAFERQSQEVRARLRLHAPVDLSGLVDCVERWKVGQVTPQELIAHPEVTAANIARRVGEQFDVVLSSCILTQLQLMVVNVLTDGHPLFEAVRYTVSLSHLRTLVRLQSPGGRGFLVTDVSSSRIGPLDAADGTEALNPLMDTLVEAGRVFHVAHPGNLRAIAEDDPKLASSAEMSAPLDVWLWQNGPTDRLLVYAVALNRRA